EALTMSDRLAVFNHGRIEQIGSPAEVYERPRTGFVAGFVGTSNLIGGVVAEQLTGSAHTFSVRPEKIRMVPLDAPVSDNLCGVVGTVRDVIYLGINTRYLVEVDGGTDLTVIQQNLESTSMDVFSARGSRVKLVWEKSNNRLLSEV
ncbi:MAG: TOBE domain-containing protein, partial [Anaerolineae bacterium]|nr:TOBE domain-containing protein [Anaerolineae bacterium]